jgi:hypothetical protein
MKRKPRKVNAGIAGRRSVLTRTVFFREGSRLHVGILCRKCSGNKSLDRGCAVVFLATHENSRREIYRRGT